MLLCVLALGALAQTSLHDGTFDAVEREFATRRHALLLRTGDSVSAPDHALDADAGWIEQLAWIDAHRRAGFAWEGSLDASAAKRPTLAAAALLSRSLDRDPKAIAAEIATALSSPFHAVRTAALDRASEAIAGNPRVGQALAASNVAESNVEEHTRREYARLMVRAGFADRSLALATDWPPAECFVARLDAPIPDAAREAPDADGLERAIVAALGIVRAVRRGDGEPIGDDQLDLAASLCTRESERARVYVIDDAVKRFVAAIEGRDHSAGAALGERLMRAACDGERSERVRMRCAAAAAHLLPGAQLLAGFEGVDAAVAGELWGEIDLLPHVRIDEGLEAWLTDERDELRETVSRSVGARFAEGGDRDLLAHVVAMLTDHVPTIRSLAFHWLAASDPDEGTLRAMYDAWVREGAGAVPPTSERQQRWLHRVPRNLVAGPFREAFLRLARSDDPAATDAIELLGAFRGSDAVAQCLRNELTHATERILGSDSADDILAADGRAALLAVALARVAGAASIEAIDDAARRTMHRSHAPGVVTTDRRPKLAKTVVALLARANEWTRLRDGYMGDEVPRRVRYEAALALAPRTAEDPELARRVATVVRDAFRDVDGTLRFRGIVALGKVPGPDSEAFVEAVIRGVRDQAELQGAIESTERLGRHGTLARLVRAYLIDGEGDELAADSALHAARSLGRCGVEGARRAMELLDEARGVAPLDATRELIRGALVVSLLQGTGPVEVRERAAREVLSAPRAAARDDLEARFRGERLAEATFRYRDEIEAFTECGRRGVASVALTEDDLDGRLDGRLLLALGRSASVDVRVRLLRAAEVSLMGEGRGRDSTRRLAEARLRLAAALVERGEPRDLREAVLVSERVYASVLRGALSARVLGAIARDGRDDRAAAAVAFEARLTRVRALVAAGAPPADVRAAVETALPYARLDPAWPARLRAIAD